MTSWLSCSAHYDDSKISALCFWKKEILFRLLGHYAYVDNLFGIFISFQLSLNLKTLCSDMLLLVATMKWLEQKKKKKELEQFHILQGKLFWWCEMRFFRIFMMDLSWFSIVNFYLIYFVFREAYHLYSQVLDRKKSSNGFPLDGLQKDHENISWRKASNLMNWHMWN